MSASVADLCRGLPQREPGPDTDGDTEFLTAVRDVTCLGGGVRRAFPRALATFGRPRMSPPGGDSKGPSLVELPHGLGRAMGDAHLQPLV